MIYFTRQEQRIAILLGILMLLGIGLLLVKRFQPGWILQFSLGKPDFDVEKDEVSPRLKSKPPDKTDASVASDLQPEQQKEVKEVEAEKPVSTEPEVAAQSPEPPMSMDKVNIDINTASRAELDTLPGIGPVLAQRIIDYRLKYGNFKNIRELTAVNGIGDATLQKLMDKITVTDHE